MGNSKVDQSVIGKRPQAKGKSLDSLFDIKYKTLTLNSKFDEQIYKINKTQNVFIVCIHVCIHVPFPHKFQEDSERRYLKQI